MRTDPKAQKPDRAPNTGRTDPACGGDLHPGAWPDGLARPNDLQRVLHRDQATRREAIILALWDDASPTLRRWASALNNCGRSAKVYVDPDEATLRPWILRCAHRACPFCGRWRTARLADGMARLIGKMRAPKHLVLTFRSNPDPLEDQVKLLRRAFGKLRRRGPWRARVRGGFYTVEITRNHITGLWHPHLHAVIDANYFPQPELVELWGQVMPGGRCVWIRQVSNVRSTALEIGKYVAKPPNVRTWPDHAIRAWARAVHGGRMVQAFGSCHGAGALEIPAKAPAGPRTYSVSVRRLVGLARAGHVAAVDLAVLIRRRWAVFRAYLAEALPDLPALASFERRARIFHLGDENKADPTRAPPCTRAEAEKLRMALFAAFTRFRQLDEAGTYAFADLADLGRPVV